MKTLFTILVVGACLAHAEEADNKYGIWDLNKKFPSVYDRHYSQHRTSVDSARLGMQERLSKLEAQTGYQRSLGGNENYVAGCVTGCTTGASSAYTSRSSTGSSSHHSSSSAHDNQDYHGVGILSHNRNSEESDVQQRVSSRYSAGSAFEADDLQQRQVPGDLSNIHSSAYRQSSRSSHREEEEEEDLQKNIGAGYHDLSVNNDKYLESQSHRRSQQQQKESESRVTSGGRPVYYVPGTSSTSYRSSSSGGTTESQHSESRTVRPVVAGQHISLSMRPGQSTVLSIPVSAQDGTYSSSNRRDYQAGSESSRTRVGTGQISYYPSYSSDRAASSRTDSESSRSTSHQQPEKLTSTDYSRSRYNNEESEEEDTQQRVVPSSIGSNRHTSATSGGSSNYHISSRVVPAVPIHTVESSSATSQKAAEEYEDRRYTHSRPVYNQRTTGSRNDNEQSSTGGSTLYSTGYNSRPISGSRTLTTDGSQYGTSGSTYYTAPVSPSRSNIQSQSQHGSSQNQYTSGGTSQYQSGGASQYQTGGTSQHQLGGIMRTSYGGYPAYSTRTTGSNSQHGSSGSAAQSRFNSHTASTSTGDLNEFMSESERLARVQQNQIAGSQGSSSSVISATEGNRRTVNTASNLDAAAANFVSSSNLANRLSEVDNVENIGGTGYKRVKSWQKQSKWASGSEYGTDGNPKSYSMLSTAEAEKHNINGAETGYKAATTTLENDGKVSTYSIHTP